MNTRCTTHFHACDCREEKFKLLQKENEAFREVLRTILKFKGPEYMKVIEQYGVNYETDNSFLQTL